MPDETITAPALEAADTQKVYRPSEERIRDLESALEKQTERLNEVGVFLQQIDVAYPQLRAAVASCTHLRLVAAQFEDAMDKNRVSFAKQVVAYLEDNGWTCFPPVTKSVQELAAEANVTFQVMEARVRKAKRNSAQAWIDKDIERQVLAVQPAPVRGRPRIETDQVKRDAEAAMDEKSADE